MPVERLGSLTVRLPKPLIARIRKEAKAERRDPTPYLRMRILDAFGYVEDDDDETSQG